MLTVGLPIIFIFQTKADENGQVQYAWQTFWNTFGASNQLLAALALIGVTIWLYSTRKKSKVWLVTLIPAIFMFIMSNWALCLSIYQGWILKEGNQAIPVVSFILVVLSILVAVETIGSVITKNKAEKNKYK